MKRRKWQRPKPRARQTKSPTSARVMAVRMVAGVLGGAVGGCLLSLLAAGIMQLTGMALEQAGYLVTGIKALCAAGAALAAAMDRDRLCWLRGLAAGGLCLAAALVLMGWLGQQSLSFAVLAADLGLGAAVGTGAGLIIRIFR